MSNDDDRARYSEHSAEIYDRLMDVRKTALELQGHYGKWLVATLLLIHGASIGFIANSERLSKILIPDTLWIFVAGLVFALGCGFITWINWGLNFVVYDSVSPAMKYDIKEWPKFEEHKAQFWIKATFWISILIGFLSVGCIIYGAFDAGSRIIAFDSAKVVSEPAMPPTN